MINRNKELRSMAVLTAGDIQRPLQIRYLKIIFCARWQNYGFGLRGRLFIVKACKIATIWIICCIYYGFADAGRGALSCLLAPVPGCKKP